MKTCFLQKYVYLYSGQFFYVLVIFGFVSSLDYFQFSVCKRVFAIGLSRLSSFVSFNNIFLPGKLSFVQCILR